jgi:hypothetical protein
MAIVKGKSEPDKDVGCGPACTGKTNSLPTNSLGSQRGVVR